jgi:Rrf2 family protein
MMWEISRLGGENGPVSLSAVSRRCHIPRNSLAPLALELRNHGLLKGVRGSHGGYRLGRPSRQIPLRQIIEACAGPINIVECVATPATCLRSDSCDCRLMYGFLNRRIQEALDSVTLGEIQDPSWLRSPERSRQTQTAFDSFLRVDSHTIDKEFEIQRGACAPVHAKT